MPYRYPPEFRRKVLDLLAAESPGVVRRGRYEAIQTMRGEGLPTQVACRVLEVSESGFYEWRTRPPSVRSICHAWLADLIHQIHQQSRGTYGPPRVHAELRLGYGIRVGHNAEGGAHETSRPAGPDPSLAGVSRFAWSGGVWWWRVSTTWAVWGAGGGVR